MFKLWGQGIGGSIGLERHGDWYCLCRFDVGLVLYERQGTVWVPQEFYLVKLCCLAKNLMGMEYSRLGLHMEQQAV